MRGSEEIIWPFKKRTDEVLTACEMPDCDNMTPNDPSYCHQCHEKSIKVTCRICYTDYSIFPTHDNYEELKKTRVFVCLNCIDTCECSVCNLVPENGADFILCDGCETDGAQCIKCIGDPNVRNRQWFCETCRAKRDARTRSSSVKFVQAYKTKKRLAEQSDTLQVELEKKLQQRLSLASRNLQRRKRAKTIAENIEHALLLTKQNLDLRIANQLHKYTSDLQSQFEEMENDNTLETEYIDMKKIHEKKKAELQEATKEFDRIEKMI